MPLTIMNGSPRNILILSVKVNIAHLVTNPDTAIVKILIGGSGKTILGDCISFSISLVGDKEHRLVHHKNSPLAHKVPK